MKIHLDCIPCNLRQVLEAVKLATADPALQSKIVLESMEILKDYNSYKSSPALGRAIHNLVPKHTGVKDPYRELKADSIRVAHQLYPMFERSVDQQTDRLRFAVEVSALGNLIDAAVYGVMDTEKLQKELQSELARGFGCSDLEKLRQEAENARIILIIGDNAGETVFDKLLITELKRATGGRAEAFFAVRSEPIINDAVLEDAAASGLDEVAVLIESGSTAPGTVLAETTAQFRRLFHDADLVISKGQGNYETLSGTNERPVYYLLKAKCLLVAEDIGVSLGDNVLLRK